MQARTRAGTQDCTEAHTHGHMHARCVRAFVRACVRAYPGIHALAGISRSSTLRDTSSASRGRCLLLARPNRFLYRHISALTSTCVSAPHTRARAHATHHHHDERMGFHLALMCSCGMPGGLCSLFKAGANCKTPSRVPHERPSGAAPQNWESAWRQGPRDQGTGWAMDRAPPDRGRGPGLSGAPLVGPWALQPSTSATCTYTAQNHSQA